MTEFTDPDPLPSFMRTSPLPSNPEVPYFSFLNKEKIPIAKAPEFDAKKPLLRVGTPLIIPQGYEFVVLTGVSSIVLLTWKKWRVSEARKMYKVPPTLTYSEDSEVFNCTQRALQSTMDIYPQYLFLLMIGGLEMPFFSSIGGVIWVFGRYIYANGYFSGDPRNRTVGSFYLVGHAMLILSTLKFAYKRIMNSL